MVDWAAASIGLGVGAVVGAFVFGLRHGLDPDHIAAIGDIATGAPESRRALRLATTYAAGHILVVAALGSIAVAVGDLVPAGVDATMRRVVGITLVALGLYVFYSLVTRGADFRLHSRWLLVLGVLRRTLARARTAEDIVEIVHEHEHDHAAGHDHDHGPDDVRDRVPAVAAVGASTRLDPAAPQSPSGTRTHRHLHRHVLPMPHDPFDRYGSGAVFGIGMLHGIGAETPTQVLLFVAAAGANGRGAGMALLVAFSIGLFISNALLALAAVFGLRRIGLGGRLYRAIGVAVGAMSIAIGTTYVAG